MNRFRVVATIWAFGILLTFIVFSPCFGQKKIKMKQIKKMEKEKDVAQLMEIMDKSRYLLYLPEKIEAVKALERLGDPQALPVLQDIVKSGNFSMLVKDSTRLVETAFRSILTFKNPEAVIAILREKENVPPYYFKRGWNALTSMNLSEVHYRSMAAILGEKIPPNILSSNEIQTANMALDLTQLLPDRFKVEPLIVIMNSAINNSNQEAKKCKENAAQKMSKILKNDPEAMTTLMTIALNHARPGVVNKAIKLISASFNDPQNSLHDKFKQTLRMIQSSKTVNVNVHYKPGNLTVTYDDQGNPQQATQLQKVPIYQKCFEDTLKSDGFQIASETEADYIFQFQFRESPGGSVYGRRIVSYYTYNLKMGEGQIWDAGWNGPNLEILEPTEISRALIDDVNVYLVIRKFLEMDALEN